MKNKIKNFYYENQSLQTTKFVHYLDVYWHHLGEMVDKKNINVLEIGVRSGGSLLAYQSSMNEPNIFGLDCNPECKLLEGYGFKIFIGPQADNSVLQNIIDEKVISESGLHFIVDDGSHIPSDFCHTLKRLWPVLAKGGLYIIEDYAFQRQDRSDFVDEILESIPGEKKSFVYDNMLVIHKGKDVLIEKFEWEAGWKFNQLDDKYIIHSGKEKGTQALPLGMPNSEWVKQCQAKSEEE